MRLLFVCNIIVATYCKNINSQKNSASLHKAQSSLIYLEFRGSPVIISLSHMSKRIRGLNE